MAKVIGIFLIALFPVGILTAFMVESEGWGFAIFMWAFVILMGLSIFGGFYLIGL